MQHLSQVIDYVWEEVKHENHCYSPLITFLMHPDARNLSRYLDAESA